MLRWPAVVLFAALFPLQPAAVKDGPAYTAGGELKFPAAYPEWVFLGTGMDMSYSSDAATDRHMFNSVYANPDAWRAFKATGVWPDGTMLVLENRGATGAASINKRGQTQSADVMGLEVHVKDTAHNHADGWTFYNFDDPAKPTTTGKQIPRPAGCYTCHEQHGATGTTFAQFYPAALAIAKEKGTLSPDYLKESAAAHTK